MYSELTNLLPREKTKALRRVYFIRLATVGVVMLIAIIFVQIALLLPSYLYERDTVNARALELKRLSVNLATTQQQAEQAQLATMIAESTSLLTLNKAPTASAALRAVLAVPRPGITLSGFTYGESSDGTSKTMQLTGIADTREDLRAYDAALAALPFVASANLPISEYAQDTNIPLNIILTGSLAP